MKIMDYNLDIDNLARKLKTRGWKHIGLQFPEGLKPYSLEIIRSLKEGLNEQNVEFLISGSSCYGACDLADSELMFAGAEGMVHFGHTDIPNLTHRHKIPVIFEEMNSGLDIIPVVKKALDTGLLEGIVGITTTVQYIHKLPMAHEFLQDRGVDARIGNESKRLSYPGQVLGCSFSCAADIHEADTHLFIGEGYFHPLGISLVTKKRVVAADPRTLDVRDMEKEKHTVLKQRFAAIQKLKESWEIGVILSTLPGQCRMEYGRALCKLGKEHGKEMHLIVVSHISPQSLRNLGIGVTVSTACPRVAIDDYGLFLEHKIICTTPIEFMISLGLMKWEDYLLDSIER